MRIKILLAPAVWLLRRLRLFPKFGILTFVFTAPLALVTALLVAELQKSIVSAERERIGVGYIRALGEAIQLAQRHRALTHMALSGNAEASEEAAHTRAKLQERIASPDMEDYAARLGLADHWVAAQREWIALQNKREKTSEKERYAEYSTVIDRMHGLKNLAADRSGLTLDTEIGSRHLIDVFVDALPGIAEALSEIAGRGAAYIDTGLLEANEDLLLNSSVMVARRDLARIPARLEAVSQQHPGLGPEIETTRAAVPASLNFLDRARDEVLNSYNQTSGSAFFEAGSSSISLLYASAETAALMLDRLLEMRMERYVLRRNLMLGAIFASLLIAAYLLAAFFTSFAEEVGRLQRFVGRAAHGDLAEHLSSDAKDEIGDLSNGFGRMSRGLAALVGQVRASGESITAASTDIASGNADLSARSDAQAASLQETACSMAELTATVKGNASNAGEANQVAMSAARAALDGSKVVRDAVATMRDIKAGSSEIGNIIGVIDGIALQTNLLALNAAVEAARAGVHGRGFAVVASEVRSLAQLSATSAKQVRTLIDDSVRKIEEGSRLVHAAGGTMDEIVSSVQHMAGLMARVAAGCEAQTAGIEQVNRAVADIDKATRENRLLAEKVASGAGALEAQAASLAQAVAVFRLNDMLSEESREPQPASDAPQAIVHIHPGYRSFVHQLPRRNDGWQRRA